jgi:hypothetical protein
MILEAAFGLSLVLKVSLNIPVPVSIGPSVPTAISAPQKDAVLLPLVRKATACILRRAAGSPRSKRVSDPQGINDIIVEAIAACRGSVRTMIRMHDRLYGSGSGEAFLLGPYLDVLPAAVIRQVNTKWRPQ